MSEADEFMAFMVRKLRDRAEEARTMVETFHDPEAKRMMSEIAERNEKLASQLEIEG